MVPNVKDFMRKKGLKDESMNESEFGKVCKFPLKSKDSKIPTDETSVIFDNGSMGGTHCTSFHKKDDKMFDLDSFGGYPDKFSL